MDKTLRCCMRMNWPVKIYISSIIQQSITLGNECLICQETKQYHKA